MRKSKNFLLVIALALIPLTLYGATDTSGVYTKAGSGTYLTGKTTEKWASHGATPTVQQAATVTAFAACQAKGIIAAGQDYSVQHETVALTAANLIAMYTTPVAIVAAPGAGKSIVITKLVFTITRTATAFTGGAAVIFQYGSTANGAGTQALDSTLASTVVTGGAGTTVSARNGAVISDLAAATIQNAGLYISNGTAAFAAGTGTATVDVWYVVQ
jgi:hypothetical protein